jgi:hypothetical protein
MRTEVNVKDEPRIMAEVEAGERCPICWEIYAARCRCPRGDQVCESGHTRSRCLVHNQIVHVHPDDNTHAVPTDQCICHLTMMVKA